MAETDIGIKLSLQGQNEVTNGLNRVTVAVKDIGGGASAAIGIVRELGVALGAAFTVRGFVQAADAVTTLNNQLRLATGSAQAAAGAYSALFDIAQRARVSFSELGGTYAAISRAGEQLGVSQTRLLNVTEAISNAVTISGSRAESAKAALIQLGQGLASGTLRGDELNSVMEQTPRLASALAAGLGITTGELRKMGEAGEITADKVIKALESQASVLKGEVAGSVLTVGQAWQQLTNSTVKAVGDIDSATGASNTMARAMQSLGSAIETVGTAAKEHQEAISVVIGILAGAAVATGISATVTAIGSMGAAISTVGTALAAFGGVVAALNPVTLALLGIGAVAGGAFAFSNRGNGNIESIGKEISAVSKEIAALDAAIERSQNAKGVLLPNGAFTTKERAKYLRDELRQRRDSLQAQYNDKLPEYPEILTQRAKADAAQDKLDQAAMEKARALVKTRNSIINDGYKDAVTIAQNYQSAIDAAERRGNNDDLKRLTAERDALLIGRAKETSEAIKSFNEKDTATAREAAKVRLDETIAGYEREQTATEQAAKRRQQANETAHALGLTSEREYQSTKTQIALQTNQANIDTVTKEYDAVKNSGLLQKERVQQEEKYKTELQKLVQERVTIVQEGEDAIAIAEQKAYRDGINANADTLEKAQQRTEQLQAEVKARKQANAELGLSAVEVDKLRSATMELDAAEKDRLANAIESADPAYAQELRNQAQAMRKLVAANAEGVAKAAAIEQFNAVWQSVDRTAHDTFVNIFEGGQDAFTKLTNVLKSTLLDLLYQMTVRKWVFNIVADVVPGASGATAAAVNGTGTLGSLSNLSSLSSLAKFFGFGSSSAGASLTSLAYANGVGLLGGDSLGALIGANGGWAGVPASTAAGTAATGAGSMSGLAAIPGWGWAAMAAGALLTQAGSPQIDYQGSGLQGSIGGRGAALSSYNVYKEDHHGLFGIGAFTTENREYHAADSGVTQYIDNATKLVTGSVKSYATALGLSTDAVDGFTKQIDVSLAGLDPAKQKEAIDKAIGGFGEDLVSSVYGDALKGLGKSGETAGGTLQRLATDLLTVNDMLKQLHEPLFDVSVTGAASAAKLVDAFGGLDKMNESVGVYYDKFYSDSEKAANSMDGINSAFEKLGIAAPQSKEQFRALVDSLDLTTESGRTLYAAIISLAPAFDAASQAAQAAQGRMLSAIQNWGTSADVRNFKAQQLQQTLASGGLNVDLNTILGSTKDSVLSFYNSLSDNDRIKKLLLDNQQTIYDFVTSGQASNTSTAFSDGGGGGGAGQSAADSIKSAWQSITDSIWDEVKRIRGLLDGTGPEAYAAAQARFAITTAQARAGDQDAAKALPEVSRTLQELAQQNAASALDLRILQGKSAASLSETATILARKYGLSVPKFAAGTNYTQEGLAYLHEGEAVVPKAYNPAAGAPVDRNTDLLDAVRSLANRLDVIEANTRASAQFGGTISRALKKVMPDGDAIEIRTATA